VKITIYQYDIDNHLPYPDACKTCAAVLRIANAGVAREVDSGRSEPRLARPTGILAPQRTKSPLVFYCWKGSTRRQAKGHHLYTPNTDKVRSTVATRSTSLRLRHRIRRPHLPRRPDCSPRKLEHWLTPHFAQMGAHKYLEELQKKKQSDVMRFLLRVRCWEVRHTDT